MIKAYSRLQARINSLRADESGNAAEYGLIIGLIAVAIIGALTALGLALAGVFGDVTAALP